MRESVQCRPHLLQQFIGLRIVSPFIYPLNKTVKELKMMAIVEDEIVDGVEAPLVEYNDTFEYKPLSEISIHDFFNR